MSCHHRRKQLDEMMLGFFPSGADAPELAAHLRTCAECGRYYQRVMLAMRQLSGAPQELSAAELAYVGSLVLGAQAATARPRRRASWAIGAGVAASLALCALFLLPLGLPKPDAGRVAPRGAGTPIDAALRAFCLRDEGPLGLRVLSESSGEPPRLSCEKTGLLQFAYLLRDDQPAYLYLVGLDESGAVLPYVPRDPEAPSVRIEPTSAELALATSVRLQVRHQPGTVRVVAFVSRKPLLAAEAARLLGGGDAPPELLRFELTLEIAK